MVPVRFSLERVLAQTRHCKCLRAETNGSIQTTDNREDDITAPRLVLPQCQVVMGAMGAAKKSGVKNKCAFSFMRHLTNVSASREEFDAAYILLTVSV